MGEWREIPQILKLSKLEIGTWLATFLLTVFADLTTAVEAGMIMAVLVFIRRVSLTTTVSLVTEEYLRDGHAHILQHKEIPNYVAIFRIHGPFLFGTTEKIEEITSRLNELPAVVILRLRNMTATDATGIQALETAIDAIRGSGRAVLLCGARGQAKQLIEQSGVGDHVGLENMLDNIADALDRAKAIHLQGLPAHA
jgi:SulP family sulfate permease